MRSRVGVVIGVIAIVLAIVAMVGPWWTMNFSVSAGSISGTGHADYSLFGGTSTVQFGSTTTTNTSDYKNTPNVGSVFLLGAILTILGIILGIGMIVMGAMSGTRPSSRRLGAVLGILAFLVVLVGTLYVMSALPGAVNQDSGSSSTLTSVSGFWGTKSTTLFGATASLTWGAGWAWYLALVAAIIFLVGGIAMLLARTPVQAQMAPPPAAMPPQMPPQSP